MKPILMSALMVRAILAGTKTQTRRLVKPQPGDVHFREMDKTDPVTGWQIPGHSGIWNDEDATSRRWGCPYGVPGSLLWVREAWGKNPDAEAFTCFKADPGHDYDGIKWKPSIHMPRCRSRLTLEITEVRVQRLNEISEDDARAEGVEASTTVEMKDGRPCYTIPFQTLWNQIHGCDAWEKNPLVWCLSFKKL